MLPAHVTMILLSATVPNTKEFADWVGRTKQRNIYVISTPKRPVPLEHHLFLGKELFNIVDSTGKFSQVEYRKAYEIIHPPKNAPKPTDDKKTRDSSKRTAKPAVSQSAGSSGGNKRNASSGLFVTVVQFLKKKDLLPCIIFAFSKKKCEEFSAALTNIDLTTNTEKSKIHTFISRSLTCLLGTDKQLPQVLRLTELLSRGIGVHHSGLLPILKEIVEILFTKGLVKVLFATETFAMGVNAPARSVVFAMIRKHDGESFRNLQAGEYTQMSGRAGRRGLDSTGMVIIACQNDIPDV
jgi:antiviral helicase SKI2